VFWEIKTVALTTWMYQSIKTTPITFYLNRLSQSDCQ
jgi:hypothetical protein